MGFGRSNEPMKVKRYLGKDWLSKGCCVVSSGSVYLGCTCLTRRHNAWKVSVEYNYRGWDGVALGDLHLGCCSMFCFHYRGFLWGLDGQVTRGSE